MNKTNIFTNNHAPIKIVNHDSDCTMMLMIKTNHNPMFKSQNHPNKSWGVDLNLNLSSTLLHSKSSIMQRRGMLGWWESIRLAVSNV